MNRESQIRWSAIIVLFGGAMWVIKGGLIMIDIIDLGWMVIASQALLAFAVPALYLRLGNEAGQAGRIALMLAYVSMGLSIVNTAAGAVYEEPKPILFNITYMIGILSLLGAMICIGLRTYQTKTNPAPLRWLPASIGLLSFPVIALASLVHLELGIVVLGFVWMWLARLIWNLVNF